MSRENKSLIINAGIFVLIAVLFLVGMSRYDFAKELSSYRNYFPQATNFKIKKLKEEPLTEVITIYKGKNEIGYLYTGHDSAEDIPGHDQWSLLKLQVVVDEDKKIVEVIVLENEHTPSFFANVEKYLPTLKGTYLANYKEVDEIGGASEFSMPIVKAILDKITKLQTGSDPLPAPEKDPYLLLFEDYEKIIKDDTFVGNEYVIKKEEVKDEAGVTLGFVYTLKGVTDVYLDEQYKQEYGELTLLVALDESNKVIGIKTLESTQTSTYYDKYEAEYEKLIGEVLEGTKNVDIIGESTISGNLITKLINELKGVLE